MIFRVNASANAMDITDWMDLVVRRDEDDVRDGSKYMLLMGQNAFGKLQKEWGEGTDIEWVRCSGQFVWPVVVGALPGDAMVMINVSSEDDDVQ